MPEPKLSPPSVAPGTPGPSWVMTVVREVSGPAAEPCTTPSRGADREVLVTVAVEVPVQLRLDPRPPAAYAATGAVTAPVTAIAAASAMPRPNLSLVVVLLSWVEGGGWRELSE
nr:hypothetical protein [Streptomyces sp. TLI_185]